MNQLGVTSVGAFRLTTVALAAVAMACQEVPFAQAPPPEYTLLTEQVWSGGEILLVSPDFMLMSEFLRLVVGADTLPETRRARDTVAFRADGLLGGTHAIALLPSVRPAPESVAEVTVRGFQACYPGPAMSGFALPWPDSSLQPTFVADGATSAIIGNARTGSAVTAVPDSLHAPGIGMGPGYSYDPRSVVLIASRPTPDVPSAVCAWQIDPIPVPGECIRGSSSYHAVLMGPGRWVLPYHHFTYRNYGSQWDFRLEEPNGVAVSPRGDFVVVSGADYDGQLIVPVTDEPALRVPGLFSAEARAAFSPDGDTVYMAGWAEQRDSVSTLLVFEPSRPAEPIATAVLGDWDPVDMVADPVAPLLYVLSADEYLAKSISVAVIDRRTLQQVGRLYVPNEECGEGRWVSRLLPWRNHNTLFVVQSNRYRAPAVASMIYRFDLIPPWANSAVAAAR